jgi:hypothetical protein
LRWVLVIWLSLGPSTEPHPISIPQSTEVSCNKASEKIRVDIGKQQPGAAVVTLCIDQGFAY